MCPDYMPDIQTVGKCLEVLFLEKSFSVKGGRDREGEGNRHDHILSIRFYDFRQSVGWV